MIPTAQKFISTLYQKLTVILLICVSHFLRAQHDGLNGSLNVRNYSNTEYNGHPQIFSITQDHRGLMYFGNKTGILEFDGVTWRTIIVPNSKGDSREVNCLATDKNGRIYVGAKEDLGYLEVGKNGKVVFRSILKLFKIRPDLKSPQTILCTDNGVYFHYDRFIYHFDGEQIVTTIASPQSDAVYRLLQADGKIYAARNISGLYTIENERFVPARNGAKYNLKNKIYSIVNFGNGLYIQTSEGNIDDYTNPYDVKPVPLSFALPVYSAITVNDQYYSSGSFSDGLLIYDRNFRLHYRIDLSNGLIDGNVKCQFLDKEGNIWVGTNKGISKVDVISPVSRFGVNFGMISGVESICSFKGRIYYATLSGIYYLNERFDKTSDRIKKVPGVDIDCFGVRSFRFGKDSVLLIAANNGVYMLKDPNGQPVLVSNCGPYNFVQSPLDPNIVFIANYNGLSKMTWTGSGFTDNGYIEGFTEDIFNISVQQDGTLWLGTISSGILRTHVHPKGGRMKKEIIGKAEDGPTYITIINGVPYVGNDLGLFKIIGGRLENSTDYMLPKKCGVHRLMKDGNGRVWAVLVLKNNTFEIGYFDNNTTHSWYSKDFQRYSSDVVHGLFFDEKGMTWLGGPNGVMLFNPTIKKSYENGYNTILRKVSVGDSSLFSGGLSTRSRIPSLKQPLDLILNIPYSTKNISFEYAASSYFDESATVFSCKLVGQDEEWSAWSSKTEKSYTNLYEGNYTFLVKAKNIYGEVSTVASYELVILPPWYRTLWAYLLYAVLFILILYAAIQLSNRRIRRQKEHLELVVRERTAEVVEQKEEIEKQKEIVEEKNRDIMDSIRYAKRLQDAILPTDEYIRDCFREAFVFFRPKDIVSGDFYFVRKIDQKVYFAAVDCTGHGVPGAFVSIVGNNGLNRAIKEFGLSGPGEILDKLSELVIDAFRQEGILDVRDGMDIALCCLDLNSKTLEYAGANNPLYVISGEELTEIKANKQPVGLFEDRVPFTNHTIHLNQDDFIVLFSDGYADQFGGPQGKKYTYSHVKNFLIDHSQEPLAELNKQLVTEFNEWIEGHEQIDDVCVIGIRI
ncbi:MAG: SpoIIE family protein phosphatase [Flavobacteriales bacterium]